MLPPRLPCFDYLGGHRYFVTCCTLYREPLFQHPTVVSAVRSQILQSADTYHFAVLAYVFMPDHIHLFVEGRRPDADFRLFMRNWRKRSTIQVLNERTRTIWQKGYFDRVLRQEEETEQVIAYMLMNPVRAGLVESPLAYPHAWSIATHEPLS